MPEKVRLIDDPVLREVCTAVDLSNDYHFIVGLLETMNDTMKASNGIGLAANQIGQPIRVFILKRGDSYQEFINPEITSKENLVTFDKEACLSIPGTYGMTKRYKRVSLTWVDKSGIKNEGTFEDMQAFAVQHEMDHLNGKLYVDQFSTLLRKMTIKQHRKYLRGY
jgi:peptide deformylase